MKESKLLSFNSVTSDASSSPPCGDTPSPQLKAASSIAATGSQALLAACLGGGM
eukprot:COSAG06_NODE_60413_length_271_cov_0.587209_1_plen_53_part_10